MLYSLVIPVYNRPDEIAELLNSLVLSTCSCFEVIVVEDGSVDECKDVVDRYVDSLNIKYVSQDNTGPGLARNNGARHSVGEYIIFLDSDTIIPEDYLDNVNAYLLQNKADAFGGADAAMDSFSDFQKAVTYSMTGIFTTGGIRGKSGGALDKFFPRSFNMGITREVFDKTGGFGTLRFGEDIDFSYRIIAEGFKTAFIEDAFVYHKRRTSSRSFFKQVFFSGYARVNLSIRHKGTLKPVHTLPSIFILVSILSLALLFIYPIALIAILWFLESLYYSRNVNVALISIETSFIQILGYGSGFIYGAWMRKVLKRPEDSSYNTDFS